MKRHNMFIPEADMESLKALAFQKGTTYSKLVREAIKAYLEAEKNGRSADLAA